GVATVLTRTWDHDLSLAVRAEIVTSLSPGVFVSVHHNAGSVGRLPAPGTETYHQAASAGSRRLAGLIQEEVVAVLAPYELEWIGQGNAGAKYRLNLAGEDYLAMVRRPAPVTSVLAELAYLSNPPEAELLARPEVQRAEGEAVARAFLRYLTTADEGSGYSRPDPVYGPSRRGAPQCQEPAL
ncbi:MAG: N-acetylmuramoyl-L-alanine amidase family protein, partial [Acidimicrobiales bacterium]